MASPAPLTTQPARQTTQGSAVSKISTRSFLQPQGVGGGPPPKEIGAFKEILVFSVLVFMKAFHPIVIDASKTVLPDGKKAILYNTNSAIVSKDCLIALFGLVFCRVVGGSEQLKSVFDPKPLRVFAFNGFLYTLADILEMASMGGLSGASYQIMMQSSIVITALLTMVLKNVYQTRLQWNLLYVLMGSMSVYMCQTSGSGSGGSGGIPVVGTICALLKVVAVCAGAVVTDKYAKEYKDDPTHVVITRVYIFRPLMIIAASAAAGKIDANYFAHWNVATYMLVVSYIVKAISAMYVVALLDSILKTIAESVAVLVIFGFDCARAPSSFEVSTFLSVIMVVLACASYVDAKESVEKAKMLDEERKTPASKQ
jgi:hypothetical protein